LSNIDTNQFILFITMGVINHHDNHYLFICDCYYGWPTQKRPRKERIRAVAAQLHNFVQWQHIYCQKDIHFYPLKMQHQTVEENDIVTKYPRRKLFVIGNEKDLVPLQERFETLLSSSSFSDVDILNADQTLNNRVNVQFLSGVDIQGCIQLINKSKNSEDVDGNKLLFALNNIDIHSETILANNTTVKNDKDDSIHSKLVGQTSHKSNEDAIYLSPDGTITLNPSQKPPNIVVIGMLVDRNVTRNRSKLQAKQCQITSAKLPLRYIYVKDEKESNSNDDDEEPLNIDTVLEIMERWWIQSFQSNMAYAHKENEKISDDLTKNEKAFIIAATEAMKTHRLRHPKQQALRQLHQK